MEILGEKLSELQNKVGVEIKTDKNSDEKISKEAIISNEEKG